MSLIDSKPKVGIFNLSSCEGCIVQILNLGDKLLRLFELIEIVDSRVLGIKKDYDYLDLAIIEGCVMSEEEKEKLVEIRNRSKVLIALGDCAVSANKNFMKDIVNSPVEAKSLRQIVKVDYEIPGCPINSDEFYDKVIEIVMGKKVIDRSITVCSECILFENDCLLDKGLTCLGPITRGGCNALCPSNGRPCFGCRGLSDDANIDALIKAFEERGIPVPLYLSALNLIKSLKDNERRMRNE